MSNIIEKEIMKLKDLKSDVIYINRGDTHYCIFQLKQLADYGECYDEHVVRSNFIMIGKVIDDTISMPDQMRQDSHCTIPINPETEEVSLTVASENEIKYYNFFKSNFNQPLVFLNN